MIELFTPKFLESRHARTTEDGLTVIPNVYGEEITLDPDGQLLRGETAPEYSRTENAAAGMMVFVSDTLDALAVDQAGANVMTITPYNMQTIAKVQAGGLPARALIVVTAPEEEKTARAAYKALTSRKTPARIVHTDGKRVVDLLKEGRLGDLLRNDGQLWRDEETARREKAKEKRDQEYVKTKSVSALLPDFVNGIKGAAALPCVSSGWTNLDRVLDGGFYPGLYILGAVSSMGKTDAALQLAEQIAANGTDVLYISLEMAATELIARGISRGTLQLSDEKHARNIREITTAGAYDRCSDGARELIDEAVTLYSTYSDHLFVVEGLGDVGTKKIRETVKEHKEETGRTPFLIVDYLQILAPNDPRASDTANANKDVLELKRISRDYKMPVLAISSFNRSNYETKANMAAYKQTSMIEYSADVLIALQPQNMGDDAGKNAEIVEKTVRSDRREIELVILKNRNGHSRGEAAFIYSPAWHLMEEDEGFRPAREKWPQNVRKI